MTTETEYRALLEQALEALEAMQSYAKQECKGLRICDEAVDAIRAEMAKTGETVEPITTDMAVKRLCQALRDDMDYAWSWHCNIAMTAYEAGCPHDVANEGAARFMQLLAGVDTRRWSCPIPIPQEGEKS